MSLTDRNLINEKKIAQENSKKKWNFFSGVKQKLLIFPALEKIKQLKGKTALLLG